MKIFIVNGKGKSGKDSFESFVIDYAERLAATPVVKISIIDYVKDIASYAGWDGGKTMEDRRFLCDLKKILTEWNDSPMQDLYSSIQDIKEHEGENVTIFIDMREPNDIERFEKICSSNGWRYSSVLIKRDELDNLSYGNSADDNVFNYFYDIIIENNGTLEDLRNSAEYFYNNYIGGIL